MGNPFALFEDNSKSKANLMIAGMITKIEADVCYPQHQYRPSYGYGGVYLKVNWQIYSKLKREVIYEVTTEGSDKIDNLCYEFINDHEEIDIPILEIRKEVQDEQIKRINSLRKTRNNEEVNRNLKAITDASYNSENLTPLIIAAAKSYATLGEIVDSMKIVFGEWEEMAVV